MAPPSGSSERTQLPPSSSMGSGRRIQSYPGSQSLRPTPYSSLGDALGSGSRAMPYISDFTGVNSTASTSVQTLASDGRYYYQSSGLPSPYDYTHYPQTQYDSSQYAHSSLPPMRSVSPAAHQPPPPPPPSSHYNPPSTSYAPYPQQQYSALPQSTSQQHPGWADDEWGSQQPSFSPEPTQPQQMFVAGRSELTASPQADPRSYGSVQYSSPPVNVRMDDRSGHSQELSPSSRARTRERETTGSDRPTRTDFDSTRQSVDYSKVKISCCVLPVNGPH